MAQEEFLRKESKAMDPATEALMRKQRIWLKRLQYEREAHRNYRRRAQEVDDIFRDDFRDDETLYVPLYWSVVNVQHVGVYSNQPIPDIRPANENSTEIFRHVASLMDRGCRAVVNEHSFDFNAHRAIDDYLALSLGVMRAKVDTETIQAPMSAPQIGTQRIRWEYVPFNAFLWEPCNNWHNCNWVGFRHSMTRADIRRRFGKTVAAAKTDQKKQDTEWKKRVYDVYEIWDKERKQVLFLTEGESEPLEIVEDPLELDGFFPCVVMWGGLRSGELIPVPDYEFIEPYDTELNRLQKRRMGLLETIRASGAYDAAFTELGGMFDLEDAQYMPVKNLASRLSSMGGMENSLYHLPLAEKSEVLRQLTEQMQFVKAQVDDLLGISDIVRGVTKASESATAQEIKGRWVGIRLTRKRETVQYAMREVFRITTQLLANVITPENLTTMTQMPITNQMYQMLQNQALTHFSIDVETESTVAKDEFEERRTHQEMLNGIAQFSQGVLPMVQQGLLPADISSAILKASLVPYARYDRGLDEALKSLPNTQQQMQAFMQQMQKVQQDNQQLQQQLQQAMTIVNQLQQQATAAKAQKESADARKKDAETDKIRAETRNENVEPYKTAAETRKIVAETRDIQSGRRINNG